MLDVGGTIHPERIEAQRRPQIPDLHHWLLCPREDEEIARLQVPVEDVPAVWRRAYSERILFSKTTQQVEV